MNNLSNSTLTWRGLTIYGRGPARFTMNELEGWEDVDADRSNSYPRPQQHGTFDSDLLSGERVVMVTGRCKDRTERDSLLAELKAVMVPGRIGGPVEDLTIEHAGQTLTAGARLRRFKPSMANWGAGIFGWAAEWVCPDPLRYGEIQTAATTFPVRTGGLRFPLYSDGAGTNVGALDYGEVSQTGRLVLSNEGTADSWPQFVVEGPVGSSGFELITVGTGARVTYSGAVPAGSQLVLDSATGTAVIDGVADRGGRLTHRDWTPVPAGGSVEFAFVPLGATSSAVLHATVRPAFW